MEFTESSTMMSCLFAVIVLSVLTGMSHLHHSVGEVILIMRAIFRMCGNESQPGLQLTSRKAGYVSGQMVSVE